MKRGCPKLGAKLGAGSMRHETNKNRVVGGQISASYGLFAEQTKGECPSFAPSFARLVDFRVTFLMVRRLGEYLDISERATASKWPVTKHNDP